MPDRVLESKLRGSTALITGASRGIGRAIAKTFSMNGADLVINYNKSRNEAIDLAKEIRRDHDGNSLVVKADVSKIKEVRNMISRAISTFGKIDILVNNAGTFIQEDFLHSNEVVWDTTLDINLKGAYLCCREVAPFMLKQKKGRIINIASISGLTHPSALNYVEYATSKAGMIGLTRSLAVNLGPYVRVNAICPGEIETEMTSSVPPKIRAMKISEALLKRLGTPTDVAKAALFLASDDSDFITGELLTVSGGRGMS
jgi:3-oxoacyl-[acyl-carrier protein] reductase